MLYKTLFFILFLAHASAIEMPWGKDASLARGSFEVNKDSEDALVLLAGKLIGFHRNVISPADGPRSHFYPSSSQYTYQAMVKYGFFAGVLAGCDRLMRENSDPWIYPLTRNPQGQIIKSDPVY